MESIGASIPLPPSQALGCRRVRWAVGLGLAGVGGAPCTGSPRAAGRRSATGRSLRWREVPGSGAESLVSSLGRARALGWRNYSGAPGHAGQGRQVPGQQARGFLGVEVVGLKMAKSRSCSSPWVKSWW